MTGKEALGNATILGGAVNPLQVYMQQSAMRERQKAEEMKLAVQQRNELMDDLEKHSPDKVWDPFYGEINQMTNQHVREYVKRALDGGVPVPQIRQQLNKRYGDVNTEVARANMHKQTYFDAIKQLDTNKDVYKRDAKDVLRNVFFDGPNARKINEINVDQIPQSVFDNPDNFDVNGVAVRFLKTLPQRVNQYYNEIYNPLGKAYNIQETQSKLGLEMDDKGNILLDERGLPITNVPDDVLVQALQDPFISKMVARDLPNGDKEQKREYVKEILKGKDPVTIKNRIQSGFKYPNQSKPKNYIFGSGGYGYNKTQQELEERDQLLERVVKGNSTDIGYFKNIGKDFSVEYSKVDDKNRPGKFIKVQYVRNVPNEQTGYSKELVVNYLPINTDSEREKAKMALSAQMDIMDKKNSFGQEYPVYVNEKKKNAPSKPSLKASDRLKQKPAVLK